MSLINNNQGNGNSNNNNPNLTKGHPLHTIKQENNQVMLVIKDLTALTNILKKQENDNFKQSILDIRDRLNMLTDLEKHFIRIEELIFPILIKHLEKDLPLKLTEKHNEIIDSINELISNFKSKTNKDNLDSDIEKLKTTIGFIESMIDFEENQLIDICLREITDGEWYIIHNQTPQFGFCLYDPEIAWAPEGFEPYEELIYDEDTIKLPTGSFRLTELLSLMNTLPCDFTFVDSNDKVKYFSNRKNRIFERTRVVLKRDVRNCHPPSSLEVVENILDDFKSGKQSKADFWINYEDKMIFIQYFAIRNDKEEYLGTLEVIQDITNIKKLEGEKHILTYD